MTLPRPQPYRLIHKALRLSMTDTLLTLGRADPCEHPERLSALMQLELQLEQCEKHLQHENHFLHTAIERRLPGHLRALVQEHATQEQRIQALRQRIAEMKTSAHQDADDLHPLYLDYSLFVADNFIHMQEEETAITELLWALFSDAELHEIEQAIKASIPPQEMMHIMALMFSAMHHGERLRVLRAVRDQAPAQVLTQTLQVLSCAVGERALAKLSPEFCTQVA